ncbi:hypothetical protein HOL21_01170 [Candidatus Woesearchaeota archaeon]|jgi:hypothetical protein|nr:hypothetical protein [Candidatus Woesearchaeota archaeon]MBT6367693.1 hypothetical protein [Candidatus Woesearchaeota archaeon]MBT7762906.1 hypothetical protein [Candidatus Woesearchaeota archaeon]
MLTKVLQRLTPYVAATAIAFSGGCKSDEEHNVPQRETPSFALEEIVHSGKTNQQGKTIFTERSGEVVPVTIIDETKKPITDTSVVFFDGNGFKAYMVNHPNFLPDFLIHTHNSGKVFRLTKSPFQARHYTGSTNENSVEATNKFVQSMKTTRERHYAECITAEDATFRAEEESNVFDFMGTLPGVGQVVTVTQRVTGTYYKVVEALVNSGILKGGECAAFQKWYIVPPATEKDDNMRAALWFWECLPSIPAEVCGDGIDNDCDGKIDDKDSDCSDQGLEEKIGNTHSADYLPKSLQTIKFGMTYEQVQSIRNLTKLEKPSSRRPTPGIDGIAYETVDSTTSQEISNFFGSDSLEGVRVQYIFQDDGNKKVLKVISLVVEGEGNGPFFELAVERNNEYNKPRFPNMAPGDYLRKMSDSDAIFVQASVSKKPGEPKKAFYRVAPGKDMCVLTWRDCEQYAHALSK